jgi:spermidine/putrescine transport system ATP-binding protein
MTENIIEIKNLTKTFDGQVVLYDVNLSIRRGEFLTLLGPSGCGKTTLLRLISGFESLDEGSIYLQGQNITHLPPNLRHVNTVFQNYALFPHMTVFENIAFGLRCQKLPAQEIQQRVTEALNLVRLSHLAQRKPHQLSGGQQQRVAIARAIVNRPLVILFDEPLSSLDYRLRKSMQVELRQLQRRLGVTFVFVTHDQEEALSMSDRVAVLMEGRIEQIGSPRDVYEEPANLTVAKFIGEVNIFDVEIEAVDEQCIHFTVADTPIKLNNHGEFTAGEKVHVLVRPEDFRILDKSEVEDFSQMIPGKVKEIIYKGSTVDLMVQLQSGQLIAATQFFDEDDADLAYTLGERVWVKWIAGWEVILPFEGAHSL